MQSTSGSARFDLPDGEEDEDEEAPASAEPEAPAPPEPETPEEAAARLIAVLSELLKPMQAADKDISALQVLEERRVALCRKRQMLAVSTPTAVQSDFQRLAPIV